MGQRTVKRRPGKQWVEGKTFRLADEVRYMQRRVAEHASRIVTIGQLVLFSTDRRRLVTRSIRSTRRSAGPGWRSLFGGDQGYRYELYSPLERTLPNRWPDLRLC